MKRTSMVVLSLALCLSFGSVVSAAPLPVDGLNVLTVVKIEKADPVEVGEGFFTFHFHEGVSDEDRFEWTTQIDFYINVLFQALRMEEKVYLVTKNGDVVGGGLIRFPPTDD